MELIDHIREKENEGSGAPSWRAMRQAAESSHRRWLGHGMVVMVVCFQKSRSEQRREVSRCREEEEHSSEIGF
ncbi:hypothetical protein F2Q69_00060501 [Brassica cretica]|uniref:Uncharacterized protein n=1 Tax=Brassica cretica TaxID=69181 RepID=A0A8S9RQD0_BRACR|nr:hypothetical protein F2Q69_00060501 [Brassica cretica]